MMAPDTIMTRQFTRVSPQQERSADPRLRSMGSSGPGASGCSGMRSLICSVTHVSFIQSTRPLWGVHDIWENPVSGRTALQGAPGTGVNGSDLGVLPL